MNKKYHYFYKITNLINNHFYYGVHNTDNLEDGYIGSGKRLHIAYQKYGIENFKKEILKYFDTAKEAFEYEAEYVNEELVKDPDCYNIINGGKTGTTNMVVVKDNNGNRFTVFKDDPRYISGELVQHGKGIPNKYLKGKVATKDINGKFYLIDKNDEKYLSGKLKPFAYNKVLVKDENDNILYVEKDDPRYISGDLKFFWNGRQHKEETKQKIREAHQKYHYSAGEKNSQYGTCWIHNNNESIKIKKEQLEEYISNGWIKGRKMKF